MSKAFSFQQTRLDLAYASSVVTQIMHDLRVRHLQKVDRVLQYLKATSERGILFRKGEVLSIILMQIMQIM